MDDNWLRNLCATGFVGTGEWGIPHVHTGGDTMFVVAAAVVLLGLTLWAHRRFGTASDDPAPSVLPAPALAEALDQVDAAAQDLEVERTRELVDA